MVDNTPWNKLTAAMDAYDRAAGAEKPDYSCHCTALDHDHLWGSQCDGRATFAGGICTGCRYFHTFPERRENLS